MPEPRRRVNLVIDDRQVPAREGDSVLAAARGVGIEIPTLCHLDGLSEVGSCRLCLVEIAETPGLKPSCATQVTAGMVVRTDTERLRAHRFTMMEMLLAEGNHVCSVCVANGHCELQELAARLGVDHVEMRYQAPRRKVDASHPRYVFDPNRCVLCTRCVRTCDEIEGAHVWDIGHRGERTMVLADLGGPWGNSVLCTRCGKCVAVCPTGALSTQHSAVGEARHDRELIARLVAARTDHEWLLPQQNGASGAPGVQVVAPFGSPAPVVGPAPDRDGARRLRVATVCLGGCAGCHMSLLDLDEALFALAERADLVYGPLIDAKEFPDDVDVVLVEGAVANQENLELAHILRARSKVVVSFGDCAVTANVTGMRNSLGDGTDLVRVAYVDAVDRDGTVPVDEVPRLLPRVLPLHQVISVDAYLQGCPPSAPAIATAITQVLDAASGARSVGSEISAGPDRPAEIVEEAARHA